MTMSRATLVASAIAAAFFSTPARADNFVLSLGLKSYERLDGLDLSLGASRVREIMRGAQISVGVSYAGGDARGVQIAAGANLAGGRMDGLQLTSGFNYAGAVRGAQIGLFNIGGDVSGAQIGIVNIAAGAKGAQIGIVNVAYDSTAPIGLVNAIKHGRHDLDLWASDFARAGLSLKLGGRHLYTLFAGGFEQSGGEQRWLAGVGIGGHARLTPRFFFQPELIHFHVNAGFGLDTELNSLTSLRLLGGARVNRDLAVFAGPTLNLLVTRVGEGEGFGLIRGRRLSSEDSETTVRAWFGFVAGIQI